MYSPSVHINLHVYTGLVNDLAHWVKGNFIEPNVMMLNHRGLLPLEKNLSYMYQDQIFFQREQAPVVESRNYDLYTQKHGHSSLPYTTRTQLGTMKNVTTEMKSALEYI